MEAIRCFLAQLTHQRTVFPLASLFFLNLILGILGVSPVLSIIVSVLGFVILSIPLHLLLNLHRRARAVNGPMLHVRVDGVPSDKKISDQQYASIILGAVYDPWLYIRQLLNIISVTYKGLQLAFSGIPIIVFWGGVLFYFLSPNAFHETITSMLNNPQVSNHAITIFDWIVFLAILSSVTAILISPRRAGFRNVFEDRISHDVFSELDIPMAFPSAITLQRTVTKNEFRTKDQLVS